MDANSFIAKIKADGGDKDVCDLLKVSDEYKTISSNLGPKDKGPFSLNVLCIICRNLDKVPTWRERVDPKALLALTIDCVRETRPLQRPDQVKTLACIYHIHKHAIKLNSVLPPELMLKLSYMPFEYKTSGLLKEYCKTYWNILADRMMYIERLKNKNSITKLLPRLIEDVTKVMEIYDTVQFCTNTLTFLIKKLHFLYNDGNSKDLHKFFGEIFTVLHTKMKQECFDKVNEKEALDLFAKFNDCFYVVAENGSRNRFNDCVIVNVVSTARTMLGHVSVIANYLDELYLNGFCKIFDALPEMDDVENVLNEMLAACVAFDKTDAKAMKITSSFMNQFVRLFVEFCVTNEKQWRESFSVKAQYACLNLMLYLSTKKGEQHLKCDNCKVKSSLHDSLRLLFLIKHFPALSVDQNVDITQILPIYFKLVTVQHRILFELRALGCANHDKCFRKLQTDIHNTAIILNKAKYFDYSIKLFNLYVETEIRYFKDESDMKNISRALYNKSICELDYKLYEDAITDAFLSLVFSLPDGLNTEKYMSLVMDIKAKELKDNSTEEDNSHDEFQMISVVKACKMLLEKKTYGNLKPFLINLKFSEMLKHEFCMYAKLWPSIVPIAGVWRSLVDLLQGKHVDWVTAENEDDTLQTLCCIILETPNVVRTIHSEHYSQTVTTLLDRYKSLLNSPEQIYVKASLLFLKAEYDLTEASLKYGWRISPTMDPDQVPAVRTLPQEFEAAKPAIEAVELLNSAVAAAGVVPPCLGVVQCLRLSEVWVLQLLHLGRAVHALQLAHVCLQLAVRVSDNELYVRTASVLLSHALSPSDQMMSILTKAADMWGGLSECREDALVFLCCAAMYHNTCARPGAAARLLRRAQAALGGGETLDLAVGRLMEAQVELFRGTVGGSLSAVCNIQRHYLAVPNTGTKWTTRRRIALTLKERISVTSMRATRLCRALQLWRRARCSCAAALTAAAAHAHGALCAAVTDAHKAQDAQTKIDNRLKHILGLQPSNETQEHKSAPDTKQLLLTPRLEHLETMLENVVFKKTQTSPSLPCTSVFAYKMPEFFNHTNCNCYACDNPNTLILSCLTSGLEASTYFRAKETDIARNYFEGTLKCFACAETKIKSYFKRCRTKFECYVVDIVERSVVDDLKSVEIEVLIEAAFFELSQSLYERADDCIVRIHELIQETKNLDPYLKNEVMNLMATSAQLRKIVKKPVITASEPVETGLEFEMEGLKLSSTEEPKTPIVKPKNPPKVTKVVVKSEELPNVKRKVIKLNLDDAPEEEVKKPTRKRAVFKIPVPVTVKPVIESITPRTRSKPDILVTKPSDDTKMTPKTEFFTPISTPAEEFFTPMTSVKTYSKKSLRNNIVKNLEAEFSTPKADKENSTLRTDVDRLELPKTGGRSTRAKVADKKTLKRATSPGKLVKEKSTRSRLRNPTNFSVHEDK